MKREQCEVRMRILLAAKKLFAQSGFDGTTVRQICKEAKSNIALVSYHFGGKESVFFALFDTFFPTDRMRLDNMPDEPGEGIKIIIENFLRFKLEQPEMIAIIQQEIVMNSPRLENMGRYMYPIYTKMRELLEEGQRQKLFHFKSVDNTIRFIIGVTCFPQNNAFINPLLTDRQQALEAVYEDTLKFIFGGLGYTIQGAEKVS